MSRYKEEREPKFMEGEAEMAAAIDKELSKEYLPEEVNHSTELKLSGDPTGMLDKAKTASVILKRVVQEAGLIVKIGPSEHIKFEGWMVLGQLFGVTCMVQSTAELTQNDEFYGYEASAAVLRDGQVISRAESMCCIDEPNWKNKPRFQLRSMAQTRACGKAFRNCLSFIVSLAGYSATPAEEMTGNEYNGHKSEPVNDLITDKQRKRLYAIWKGSKRDDDLLKEHLNKNYGIESTRDVKREYYEDICTWCGGVE